MTIARLLADPAQQAQLSGGVLLVDEAGMVSSQGMFDLDHWRKSRARASSSLAIRSDQKRRAGDALRILERESQLQTVSVREIIRQKNAEYRAAMETLRNKPEEGFELLEKMGAIREVDWRLIGRETARAWREAAAIPNLEGKQRSVLVVTRTHDQISSITHAIRADRKAHGEIGEGREFEKHRSLDWTEAQKKQLKRYQPGQVLTFHKKVKGIAKNESLEVVSGTRDGVTARKANGQEVTLTAKQSGAYSVFERDKMEISAGDRLYFKPIGKKRAGTDSRRRTANWSQSALKAGSSSLKTAASCRRTIGSSQAGMQSRLT